MTFSNLFRWNFDLPLSATDMNLLSISLTATRFSVGCQSMQALAEVLVLHDHSLTEPAGVLQKLQMLGYVGPTEMN